MTIHTLLRIASLALAVSIGPVTRAQTTTPSQPTDPTLKGPSIPERQVSPRTSTAAGFGPDSIEKKKAGGKKPAPPISMAQFMSALGVLRSSAFPLTAEQSTKIQTIGTDFDAETKSYMDKNQAEIDTLRGQLSPTDRAMLDQQLARGGPIRLSKAGFGGKKRIAKQKGKGGATAPDAASPAAQPASDAEATARARLVEIYANRPNAQDAQDKILGVLTGDQRPLVEARLDQLQPKPGDRHGHKRVRPNANPSK
jgi:hypothetical protein